MSAALGLLQSNLHLEQNRESDCRRRVETLLERYLHLGCSAIGELEKTIAALKKLVKEKAENASQYRRMIAEVRLSDHLAPDVLGQNQVELLEKQDEVRKTREQRWKEMIAAHAQQQDQDRKREEISAAIRKVRARPGSNIPPHYQDFRNELAAQLSLPDGDLPFLAELIEVKSAESVWRGAIERAIGGEHLRVLVPEHQIEKALRWVNNRHNHLHVRLLEARSNPSSPGLFSDGYTQKLNFKKHPLQGAVLYQRLLHETRGRLEQEFLPEGFVHCKVLNWISSSH